MADMNATPPDVQELEASVKDALTQLDGTLESEVALLAGLPAPELENLGGIGAGSG